MAGLTTSSNRVMWWIGRGRQTRFAIRVSGALTKANVKSGDKEKRDAQENENQIENGLTPPFDEWQMRQLELRGALWMGAKSGLSCIVFFLELPKKVGRKNEKGGRKERNQRREYLRMDLRSFRPPLGLAAIDLKSFQIAALLPGNQSWKFKLSCLSTPRRLARSWNRIKARHPLSGELLFHVLTQNINLDLLGSFDAQVAVRTQNHAPH